MKGVSFHELLTLTARIKNGKIPFIHRKLFKRIRRHLPPQKPRRRVSDRGVISGVLWIILSGSAWKRLPKIYGTWKTVYLRFRRWSQTGLWEKIFKIFAKRVNKRNHGLIDSTFLKTHRTAPAAPAMIRIVR